MPQLIAGLSWADGLICPACRSETGQRMVFGTPAMPASDFFTADELGVDESPEPEPVMALTFRGHLRALARWCAPWEAETRLWAMSTAVVIGLVVLIALAAGSTDTASGVLDMCVFALEVFAAWRVAITLLYVVALSARRKHECRSVVTATWRALGQQPLFPRWSHRRSEKRALAAVRKVMLEYDKVT